MTLGRLVDGLLERECTVHLYRPRQHAKEQPRRNGHYAEHLFPGIRLPMYKELRLGFPATRELRSTWHAQRPDAVYIATEGPLGWSAVRAAEQLGIPTLSGFHTNFHTYSRHYHLSLFEPVVLGYLRKLHRRTGCTLVPTEALAAQLREQNFGCIEVLARGVDTELFTPARRSQTLREAWGAAPAQLVCLYVGRIAAEKNILDAVRAFRDIQQHTPEARFVLIGDGPMRAALERDNPDFVFCGMRHGEDLATHYASGDLFLFPSQSETFGNVVTEAMASGLAVVAFNQAAAGEHIEDGLNGALAATDTAQSFCARASALAGAPGALADIGRRAREYSRALDWTGIVERFSNLVDARIREAGQ